MASLRTLACSAAVAAVAAAGGASAQVTETMFSAGFDSTQGYTVGSIAAQFGTTFPTLPWTLTASTSATSLVQQSGTPVPPSGNGVLALVSSSTSADNVQSSYITLPATATTAAVAQGASEFSISGKIYIPAQSNPGGLALRMYDSTGARVLGGFIFQPATTNCSAATTYWLWPTSYATTTTTSNKIWCSGTNIAPDTWVNLSVKWNRTTGVTTWYVNGAEILSIPGASAGSDLGIQAITSFRYVFTADSASLSPLTAFVDDFAVTYSRPQYPQCVPTAGPCDAVHAGVGCNIPSCCDQVCQLQPDCCSVGWDSSCVNLAIPTCNLFVYNCSNPNTPVNNCATNPVVLSALPALVAYDTTAATTDGPPEAGCQSGNNDLPIHKDVWYQFRAPTNGTLIASNCNTTAFGGTGNFDSKIAAYNLGANLASFDPQLLPEYYIGCNEDCNDPVFTSELAVQGVVAGNYYLVRLGGYEGASGVGNLYIGVVPPPNPCDPANIINGVAGINTVTADSAYPDFVATQCAFAGGSANSVTKARFIKFTPSASGLITFQTCSDAGTSAATDSRLAAMTTCGDATTIIGCDDDGCAIPPATAPWTSKLQFNATAGTTYYVAVGGYDAGWTGSNVEIIPPTAPACPADLNNDGQVNGADLGLLLGAWGPCSGCAADLNADGQVNGADLGLLLGAWGPCA